MLRHEKAHPGKKAEFATIVSEQCAQRRRVMMKLLVWALAVLLEFEPAPLGHEGTGEPDSEQRGTARRRGQGGFTMGIRTSWSVA